MPVAVLEVGRLIEAEDDGGDLEFLGREELSHLVGLPDVELAFLALGIGVERRVIAAAGRLHLAHHPRRGLAADALEERLARDRPCVGVEAHEPAVVVEHLLEVRDRPLGIDAVAREAAADLVVDSAFGHLGERERREI